MNKETNFFEMDDFNFEFEAIDNLRELDDFKDCYYTDIDEIEKYLYDGSSLPVKSPNPIYKSSIVQKVDEVLEYIRSEAMSAANIHRKVSSKSRFARVIRSRYLSKYLTTPSDATAEAAINAISLQHTGWPPTKVCGKNDIWESKIPMWNRVAIPAEIRSIPGLTWIPPYFGAATKILTVANRRSLSYIDVPFLLGRRTLNVLDCRTRFSRSLDPDLRANNSINESQLMHWATGIKYSHLGRDRLRELFIIYELLHLEYWDVFAHDPINDLIAEDAGRHLAEQIRTKRLNKINYIDTLAKGFIEARAWVGSLLRLRQKELDQQIKADPPPSTYIHWYKKILPTTRHHPYKAPSIRRMLLNGKSVTIVKASPLVKRYIEVYSLLYEADIWEKTQGRVPLTLLQRGMASGNLNWLFHKLSEAERNLAAKRKPTKRKKP